MKVYVLVVNDCVCMCRDEAMMREFSDERENLERQIEILQ